MKKCLLILLLVFLVGCSNKNEANIKIVRDSTDVSVDENNSVLVTEEPISTKKPTVTEEPTVTKSPKVDKLKDLDEENDGDMTYSVGNTYKFANPDDFLKSVPPDNIKKFNESVPDDMLDVFPDLAFVAYDKITGNIYAKSDEYYFRFDYLKDSYSYRYELKEYADWWTYGE